MMTNKQTYNSDMVGLDLISVWSKSFIHFSRMFSLFFLAFRIPMAWPSSSR